MTFWSSHIRVLRTWAEYSHILCQTKTGVASRSVYNRIYTHTRTKYLMSQASTIHVSLDILLFHHNGPLISAYSSISSYKLVPRPMNHVVRFIPTMTQPSTTIFCISYFPHCCNLIHDAKQCKQHSFILACLYLWRGSLHSYKEAMAAGEEEMMVVGRGLLVKYYITVYEQRMNRKRGLTVKTPID